MYENHTITISLDKSKLFSAFNLARHSGKFDRKRVNRALGIVQARKVALLPNGAALVEGNSEPAYWVNSEGCDCPDHLWRGVTCKHQIARFIALKMQVLSAPSLEEVAEEVGATVEQVRGVVEFLESEREARETAPLARPQSRKGELIQDDIALLWG